MHFAHMYWRKVTLHKLPNGWDRRGNICTIEVEKDIHRNAYSHIRRRVVDELRVITSLLGNHYSFHSVSEYGPDEINECWIFDDNYKNTIRVHHKYWMPNQIEAFIEIITSLANLRKVELVDERNIENEPNYITPIQ